MPLNENEVQTLRDIINTNFTYAIADFCVKQRAAIDRIVFVEDRLKILVTEQPRLSELVKKSQEILGLNLVVAQLDVKLNKSIAQMNVNRVGKIDLNPLILGAAAAALSVQLFKLDYSVFKVDEKGFHIIGAKSFPWPWIKKQEAKKKQKETDRKSQKNEELKRSGQDAGTLKSRIDAMQGSVRDLKNDVHQQVKRAEQMARTASSKADRGIRDAGTAQKRADVALRKANSASTKAGVAKSRADAAAREVTQLRGLSRSTTSEVNSLRIAVHNLNNALR